LITTVDNRFAHLISGLYLVAFLAGCASSDVSRNSASDVDQGVQGTKNVFSDMTSSSIADSYQNASQTTKGVIIGGTAGAVTGAFSSGIGVIPGAAAGAILGGSYGAYIDSKTTLRDKLENRGIVIAVIGDQILIMVPSSRIFNEMSSTVKSSAYSTIDMIAQYINQFTNMMVKVAAYTDDSGAKSVDLALSKQQATHVAKLLSGYGVNTRLLYAEGYGGSNLVEKSTLQWDGSDNYRIEITLEKLPLL
jgi:outer membrane protein OmpA-like peptidoglycan-associated protein